MSALTNIYIYIYFEKNQLNVILLLQIYFCKPLHMRNQSYNEEKKLSIYSFNGFLHAEYIYIYIYI